MVSILNMSIGIAAMLLSTVNLLSGSHGSDKTKGGNSSLNLITLPTRNNELAVGLKFLKRF